MRALEHAAAIDGSVPAGTGVATQRIGSATRLRVVDAILSGTHEPGTSHYELLRAFADEDTLSRMDQELNAASYRTHEFGDSVFVERAEDVRSLHDCVLSQSHGPVLAQSLISTCTRNLTQ